MFLNVNLIYTYNMRGEERRTGVACPLSNSVAATYFSSMSTITILILWISTDRTKNSPEALWDNYISRHSAIRHLKHPSNYICHLPVKYPTLFCLLIPVDLSNQPQAEKCSTLTVTHPPGPISSPLFNLWFSSLHLACLHTTHHVKG